MGRILTSDRTSPGDRAALADAVSHRLVLGRSFEVRVAPGAEMHDRFIVPEAGPIQVIGASLRGVGRVLTVTGSLHTGAGALRQHFDRLWRQAKTLAVAGPTPNNGAVSEASTGTPS